MPAPAWVTPGTDLSFLKERRPRNLRELLDKGRPWTSLFDAWYLSHASSADPAVETWQRAKFGYLGTRSLSQALAGTPPGTKEQLDAIIGTRFLQACGELRDWLAEERAKAKVELKAAKEPMKGLEKRARENAAKSIARAQITQWEAGAPGHPAALTGRTLAQMEGFIAATTRGVKPAVADLYGTFRQSPWAKRDDVSRTIETASTALAEAEGRLRAACQQMRELLATPTKAQSIPGQQAEVIEAWTGYLDAYGKLGEALLVASKACIKWAQKDTAKKIEKNFASVHPALAGVLLTVNTMVTGLAALIQNLGLATGAATVNPVVVAAATAAATALTAVHDTVERITAMAVAKAEARSKAVVLEHVGQEYEYPRPSGETRAAIAEEGNWLLNYGGQGVAPALQWAAANANQPYGAAAQAIPIAGTLWRIGGLIVKLDELANPKVLQPGRDRDLLRKIVKQAYDRVAAEQPTVEVIVQTFDPHSRTARVLVNGEPGLVRDGRFQSDDATAGLRAALARWRAAGKAVNPRVNLRDPLFPAHPRLNLTAAGELTTFDTVSSAFLAAPEEEPGQGYKCQATASRFGLGAAAGRDTWRVSFLLTYEGTVAKESRKAIFQLLTLYSEQGNQAWIATKNKQQAATLLDLYTKDPGLKGLLALQKFEGLPPGPFTVEENGTVLGPTGTPISVTAAELADACSASLRRMNSIKSLADRLRKGELVDHHRLMELSRRLPPAMREELSGWVQVLDLVYEVLQAGNDDLELFLRFQQNLAKLEPFPEHKQRFLTFCNTNGLTERCHPFFHYLQVVTRAYAAWQAGMAPDLDDLRLLLDQNHEDWWQALLPHEDEYYQALRRDGLAYLDLADRLAAGDIPDPQADRLDFPGATELLDAWLPALDLIAQMRRLQDEGQLWLFYRNVRAFTQRADDPFTKIFFRDDSLTTYYQAACTVVERLETAALLLDQQQPLSAELRNDLSGITDWPELTRVDQRFGRVADALRGALG